MQRKQKKMDLSNQWRRQVTHDQIGKERERERDPYQCTRCCNCKIACDYKSSSHEYISEPLTAICYASVYTLPIPFFVYV